MHKQKKRLETIYEADESMFTESEDGSERSSERRSQLPYYICCAMVAGCFLILTLVIAVSLNPNLLSKPSIYKYSDTIVNIPITLKDKLSLAMDIVEHLDTYSYQINERLGLQPNTLTFETSKIWEDSNELLWIYSYLNYPPSCYDNQQCREDLNKKLRTIFTELSSLLTTIEFEFSLNIQIRLDLCSLIENTTRTIFVSLVSMITINQSTLVPTIFQGHAHCGNIDPTILLSKTIDHVIPQDHQKSTNFTHSKFTDDHLYQEATSCPNNTYTRILLMWNSF